MVLHDIEGQPRAIALLEAGLRAGRLHHAYLFTGPAGVGKEQAARAFAQALLCGERPGGCGSCSTCRRVEKEIHPDVLWLRGGEEEGESSREIRVQRIRDLCAALQLVPIEAPRKVALLLGAERMNAAAQNALLKTLEEPPPRTILILVSEGDEAILSTIRSRCLRVSFGPLPQELLARQLEREGIAPEEARLRASLSRGDGGLARALDAAGLARRSGLTSRLLSIASHAGGEAATLDALGLAEELADREVALAALRDAALVWRDLLVLGGGGGRELIVGRDVVAALERAAPRLPPARVLRGLAAFRTAIGAIEGNGSPRLQLEAALLRLAEAA